MKATHAHIPPAAQTLLQRRIGLALALLVLVAGSHSEGSHAWRLDTDFEPSFLAEESALARTVFVPEPGDSLLATGRFTHVDGLSAASVVRFDAQGRRLPGFAASLPSDQAIVASAPLAAGGAVLIVLSGGVASPPMRVELVRLGADGSVIGSTDAFEGGFARLTACPDGRVLVWGSFDRLGGHACNGLTRLSPDGSLDVAWRPFSGDAVGAVAAVAAGVDGSVYVSSWGSREMEPWQPILVQIDAAGAVSQSYSLAQTTPYHSLAVQSNGGLLVAGHEVSPLLSLGTDPNTGALLYRLGLARYLPGGELDPVFGAALPVAASCGAVVVLPDDRIVVEAIGAEGADAGHRTVLVLSRDGVPLLDVRDWLGRERDVALTGIEAAGTILVRHGLATQALAVPFVEPWAVVSPVFEFQSTWLDQRISRLTLAPPGVTRLNLQMTRRSPGAARAMQSDAEGRVLVSGDFVEIDGLHRPGLARFLPDGTLDAGFRPTGASLGFSELELPTNDGGVVVRTTYLSRRSDDGFYEQPWRYVRFRADGATDTRFLLPAELILPHRQLRWHLAAPDGRFLVSFFTPDNHSAANLRLAWLRSDGRVDELLSVRFANLGTVAWVRGPGGYPEPQVIAYRESSALGNPIAEVSRLADGKLLIAGSFGAAGGSSCPGLVRLHPDGTVDTSYVPELQGDRTVFTRLFGDGTAQVRAWDTSTGREAYSHFRLLPDGNRDPDGVLCRDTPLHLPLDEATGLPDLNFPSIFSGAYGFPIRLHAHSIAADGSLWGIAYHAASGGLVRFHPDRIDAITVQPQPLDLVAGREGCLHVAIGTDAPAQYQWYRDGEAIEGATSAWLRLGPAAADQSGSYSVRVQVNGILLTSVSASVQVTANSSRFVNFSARSLVGPASQQIAGFVVAKGSEQPALLRTVGLGLAPYLTSTSLLPDPVLDLQTEGTVLRTARGGADAPEVTALAEETGAFPLTIHPTPGVGTNLGSAMAIPLSANVYTATTSSGDGRSGISLFECYTGDGSAAAYLANLSLLARTGDGHESVTVGFVVAGDGPVPVLVRAVGPGLEPFGVSAYSTDPQLVVRTDHLSISVAENDDWGGGRRVTSAIEAAGAFPLEPESRDAAVLLNLESGAYTVTATASGDRAGIVLVEVYLVHSN